MNDFKEDPMLDSANSTRRGLLGFAGKGVLSVAAIGILGNNAAMAMAKGKMGSHNGDVDILNVALGLENEAIGAYTRCRNRLAERPRTQICDHLPG